MAVMRSPRASNFLYLVMGALSVAIVATVLVASGVFDRQNAGAHASATATASPAATSSTSASVPTDVSDIYRSVSPGVVYIASTTPQGQASGSGWVYSSDGTIVTNDHVVEGANKVSVRFTENGDPIDAKVVGTDPSTDIAVLQIDPSKVEGGVKPLQLADSKQIAPGQPAIAIGSPFGLQGTVTSGIVSALNREIQAPNGFTISGVIQTDAAINPGNSGGPLLDDSGRVIGINSQIETGGGQGSVGVGFAVPINTASDVVKQLETTGKVKRAFLGVSGADVTPDLAKALNLPTDHGALVQQAYKGGPADNAGLQGGDTQATVGGQQVLLGGDIIVKVNDKDVNSMDQVVEAVNNAQPGDSLKLTILRDGRQQDINVTLGERPTQIQDNSTGQ